jgi:outer membrane receptor protein involved in Fe transport
MFAQSISRRASVVAATFVAGIILQCSALAQTGGESSSRTAGPDNQARSPDTAVLEMVVVTARKREERALDVPISLVTLNGGTLAQRNIMRMEDLTPYVPDFRQTNGAIGTFRSIRGGGSPGSNYAFEQSTGLFFDNISYGKNVHAYIPFFDIERLEILRGPQVITFGNSTTTGALSVTTRSPGDTFTADLQASYEFENEEYILRGGVDVPVTDGFALRFSGYAQMLDNGWVDQIRPSGTSYGPRYDNYSGRVVALGRPNDDFTIKLK